MTKVNYNKIRNEACKYLKSMPIGSSCYLNDLVNHINNKTKQCTLTTKDIIIDLISDDDHYKCDKPNIYETITKLK